MPRPPRTEFAGAIHHVRARGNNRQAIVLDEYDFVALTASLAAAIRLTEWRCYAYCFMPNHLHLLVETPEPNLGRGMQRLNGRYAQGFNRRHGREGHLFEGRYRTTIVSREPHLGELARYLVLNPVRAGICEHPADWRWSSYRATAGLEPGPSFLALDELLSGFGANRETARERYRAFVEEGRLRSMGHVPGSDPAVRASAGVDVVTALAGV